ncbi:MAG: methionyl-tRNA formyltransferase [Planctomycetota bacterium]
MRIVFLGSGEFGLPTLKALAERHEVVGVVTQPDRRSGRGGKTSPTPIGAWAAEQLASVPLIKPENINEPEMIASVRALDADAWVVIAFGQKLGKALLDGIFACNLHASLLPRWRGAAPINAAIVAGDTETGNSVITLADRMDAGLVLGQSRRAIEPLQTAGEVHDLLAGDGPELVLDVLGRHERGETEAAKQEEDRVTIAPKMSKATGWIDFGRSAEECRWRVHGLTLWPGVAVEHAGQTFKLGRVQDEIGRGGEPGRLVDAGEGLVSCGVGLLKILEAQPAGGKMMAWRDLANGRALVEGDPVVSVQPVPERAES